MVTTYAPVSGAIDVCRASSNGTHDVKGLVMGARSTGRVQITFDEATASHAGTVTIKGKLREDDRFKDILVKSQADLILTNSTDIFEIFNVELFPIMQFAISGTVGSGTLVDISLENPRG
jgi:hypothetical protein